MEERTTGDQKNPAGSAGARQGEGAALPFPRDKLQKKPPWAEPRTKKGSRDQRKKCRARGKRSVTLTMLHAKKSWILWSSTASDLCLHCRRPAVGGGGGGCPLGPPPTLLQPVLCQWYSLKQGLFLHRFCQQTTYPGGLQAISKAPSEVYVRKGTEQHLSTLRGLHPKGIPATSHIRRPALGLARGLLDLFIPSPL